MSYELRPLSLAEILDAAFRLVQTEWKTLIGLSLIMQLPLMAMGAALPWLFDPMAQPFEAEEEITPEMLTTLFAGLGGVGLVYLILYPFIAAAVTASVGHFYLGRRFELIDAARAATRSIVRLVLSYVVWVTAYVLVIGLAFAVVGFLVAAVGAAISAFFQSAGTLGIVVGVLLAVALGGVAAFWMMFATFVSALLPPVAVLESNGIVGTVRRAYALGATSKWRLVGILFTAGMIVGIPVFGAQMMISAVPGAGLLVWGLFQAVGFAFTTSVTVVLYFDLRCRAEHYDLELLAQQVEAGPGVGRG